MIGDFNISGQPVVLWSSYFLQKGADVRNLTHRLFVTPIGMCGQGFRRALGRTDTNLREGGRHGYQNTVVFYRLSWTPSWLREEDEEMTPVEQLAQVGMEAPEGRYRRFWHHAAVSVEAFQSEVFLSPSMMGSASVLWSVASYASFAVSLSYGHDVPPVPEDCHLRAVLLGVAVDPDHVDGTMQAFGEKFRRGEEPFLAAKEPWCE